MTAEAKATRAAFTFSSRSITMRALRRVEEKGIYAWDEGNAVILPHPDSEVVEEARQALAGYKYSYEANGAVQHRR